MMTLYEKICAIYPSLQASDFHPIHGTIHLQNDGEGDYIKEWNHSSLAQPSIDQLS
jgi:hypothetical protein